ncbi:DUF2188 domain-containing protein [Pseudothioclava arenosa]|uniref:DUF2188 domain-containing protein n=1 Tax=Pseudothioclava arenosa TaxID=1795308 RepID=A0A2A4CNA0_9RHOB|nr:DUF2188 domain-containing protein [Pseudothioclava arenosa]PCD75584.1 hypothetical protein CLN94_13155 [Pseudothioclava arenosa]
MAQKGQHVVPSGGKWAVRRSGASRATVVVRTQEEAIQRARDIAKNQGTELFVHGRDGRIRDRSSFGKDPVLSKG